MIGNKLKDKYKYCEEKRFQDEDFIINRTESDEINIGVIFPKLGHIVVQTENEKVTDITFKHIQTKDEKIIIDEMVEIDVKDIEDIKINGKYIFMLTYKVEYRLP